MRKFRRSFVWISILIIGIITVKLFSTSASETEYEQAVEKGSITSKEIGEILASLNATAVKELNKVLNSFGFTDEARKEANEPLSEILDEKVKKYAENIADEAKDTISNTVKDALNDENKSTFSHVTLTRVVDGDTILVLTDDGNELRVRFIGIDTPESVNPDESKNTDYGTYASNHTKELLSNITDLWLETDIEATDKYGRTLAYIWLKESVDTSNKTDIVNYMLNAKILNDGYAVDKVYMPNCKYADVFAEICDEAEQMKAGLWEDTGFSELMGS